ncbi:hypothetical protein BX666DRAFT_1884645 [Dichotomocladium elegans]|nr:hypothetical protein BX666DRAFT_1884645 [Dichotomocladium elegans]
MDVAGLFPPTVTADVFSCPFTVYTAKKFPGMTKSTALSKAFANQGIKIITRREASYTRASDQFYAMNVDDGDNEASESRTTLAQPQPNNLSIASILLPMDIETPPHLSTTSSVSYTRIPITQYLADSPTEDST